MGEYLFGFIEQRKDSESDWRFVLPTSRIVGSDGGFRDVFSRYGDRFPKIPYKEGYPEDMSRETKALIAGDYRKGNIFINNEIGDYRVTSDKFKDAEEVIPRGLDSLESPHILDLGNHKKIIRDQDYARYFTFSDLEDIWNDELNESAEKRIMKNAKDGGSIAREVESCYNLIKITDEDKKKFKYRWFDKTNLTNEDMIEMVLNDKIQQEDKEYHLEKKKRKDALHDNWWLIWNIMKNHAEHYGGESVRMITVYEH